MAAEPDVGRNSGLHVSGSVQRGPGEVVGCSSVGGETSAHLLTSDPATLLPQTLWTDAMRVCVIMAVSHRQPTAS